MTKLILVGGFLGAGKTTLLNETAKQLARQGKSVGLITNDQTADLVDTQLLSAFHSGVLEVYGSCFCCNFDGFANAVQTLVSRNVDAIIAEPVGSCTDLSATILHPVKKYKPDWQLAPLSVLIDPLRFLQVVGVQKTAADADAIYIVKKQLEEADRILVNKTDTLSGKEWHDITVLVQQYFPKKPFAFISAKTGEGVDVWLNDVLAASDAGATIADVDYDRYAHGEAVLGWLNATAVPPPDFQLSTLLNDCYAELKKQSAEIGHVKAIFGGTAGSITSLDGQVEVREVGSKNIETLTFNARVQMPPERLETLVRAVFEKHRLAVKTLKSLMPGRPNPTYRFTQFSR